MKKLWTQKEDNTLIQNYPHKRARSVKETRLDRKFELASVIKEQ